MTEQFFITLRNFQSRENITLYYEVENHSLAQLWKTSIIENFLSENNITKDHPIEKEYAFHGFVNQWRSNQSRSLQTLCDELNFAISIVNQEMPGHGYPYIDLHFTIESLQDEITYRKIMNDIHHHFELLIGQIWDMSDWYKLASKKTRWAINQLNTRCHEIEGLVRAIERQQLGHPSKMAIFLSYNGQGHYGKHPPKKRYELQPDDYLNWVQTQREWGTLTVYYSQLGKSHREVYMDGDEVIDKKNISSTKHMVGEAIAQFTDVAPGSNRPEDFTDYDAWLIKHGWDPNDPTLCKGYCILARIDMSKYPEKTWQDVHEIVRTMDDIYEIGFIDEHGNKNNNKIYPKSWQQTRSENLDFLGI